MRNKSIKLFSLIGVLSLQLQLVGCGGDSTDLLTDGWPIDKDVKTTADQQVLPVALSADAPQLNPNQVSVYEKYGYSDWQKGDGTNYSQNPDVQQPYDKRAELAPAYTGAPAAARLLKFFSISDIHIADKESPAQPNFVGWSALFGPSSAGLSSAWSPVINSTTQVLDAAVQTINELHKKSAIDFGISLGDDINNTQYNELRWFIDVMDGKVISPSSGAHLGADDIDYQKPFKAAGLDKSILWYQTIGNHDQFWMGSAFEDAKTMQAHVSDTVINMANDPSPTADAVDRTGTYMGVVDGTTIFGDIIKAGPQEDFATPPMVVADPDRRTLSTSASTSLNWMTEFFNTTSKPVGHGFTQANLDSDFACYSFEPKSDIPIKVIVLDDTCKGPGQPNYAAGCLDSRRTNWLRAELEEGQQNGKLMIIAAHIPIRPQASLTDPTIVSLAWQNDTQLLSELHNYPNLIMWISGHRHVNVVTPQPDPNGIAERSFWEVETASLRDFPQHFRIFDIRRNTDNTLSMFVTDVDPAVAGGSPAETSRGYAIAASRIFGAAPANEGDAGAHIQDIASNAYNAELVKQLTPEMQAKIANLGTSISAK